MQNSRDTQFTQLATQLGYTFDGEIKIGGNYVSAVRHESHVYISGQIPRLGDTVVVVGRVGAEVSVPQAQLAAKVCACGRWHCCANHWAA
jgi:enamine deaminase RidA (YjgF/YER057c/UK114 family)